MSHDRGIGVSALERVEALLANPALYALAALVPERPSDAGGRRRDYPTYMWLLFEALISVYGSARRVEAELSHPLVWNLIRKTIRRRFPTHPTRHLSGKPMRRHHYLYGRNRYLTDPDDPRRTRARCIANSLPTRPANSGSSIPTVPARGPIPI